MSEELYEVAVQVSMRVKRTDCVMVKAKSFEDAVQQVREQMQHAYEGAEELSLEPVETVNLGDGKLIELPNGKKSAVRARWVREPGVEGWTQEASDAET